MNRSTLFATPVANFSLVIGRSFLVESVVGIYSRYEIVTNRINNPGLALDSQGGHPMGLKERTVNTAFMYAN
jgi:hypothetical protein